MRSENYEFTAAQLGVFKKQWELKAIIKENRGKQVDNLEECLKSLTGGIQKRIWFVA